MEAAAYSNKRGFTLVELMVAILIMTVGLLALLQTVNLALYHNLSNQLRNEAALVADEQMALEMSKPFASIATSTTATAVSRNNSNGTTLYTVTKTGTSVSTSTKSVLVAVQWKFKGQNFTHSVTSMLSQISP